MYIRELKTNVAVEVNEKQYRVILARHTSICAIRTEGGKYYVKLMLSQYANQMRDILNDVKN